MVKKLIHMLAVFSFVLMGTQFVHAHEITIEASHVHIGDDQSVSDHGHENGHGNVKLELSAEKIHGKNTHESEVHCGAHLLAFSNSLSVHFIRGRDDYLPGTSYHEKMFLGSFELPPPRA